MKQFKADMHIHTVLSPCADLEMSPDVILSKAQEQGLDIIAITDHNACYQVNTVMEMAQDYGIFVIAGVEINSKEEVHALAYFKDIPTLMLFQEFIDLYLPKHQNRPELFGDQVVVDAENQIVFTEQRLLVNALNKRLKDIETKVHQLGGMFIPAHIKRRANGILSQLGMIPKDLEFDALEITSMDNLEKSKIFFDEPEKLSWIASSDAHYPDQIGCRSTLLRMEEPSFEEIKQALRRENGRGVEALNFQK